MGEIYVLIIDIGPRSSLPITPTYWSGTHLPLHEAQIIIYSTKPLPICVDALHLTVTQLINHQHQRWMKPFTHNCGTVSKKVHRYSK